MKADPCPKELTSKLAGLPLLGALKFFSLGPKLALRSPDQAKYVMQKVGFEER